MDPHLYQQDRFRQVTGTEFRPGGLMLTEELAEKCSLRPGQRVLDLGCGVGATATFLRNVWKLAVTGLDASPDFLAEAERRDPAVEWALGRADALPFPDGSFDAVFAECFLSTFADQGPVLAEIRRVLRPGGFLALSDMYLRAPEAALVVADAPESSCLRGARGEEEGKATVEAAGFTVTWWCDRSYTLKSMMAGLIMSYGSADAFWRAAAGCGPGDAASGISGADISASKPGYCLLVATRRAMAILLDYGFDPTEPRRG